MPSHQPRIAITGGPGVGKSTVLSYLAAGGYSTVSADALARSLVFGELSNSVGLIAGIEVPLAADALRNELFGKFDENSLRVRREMNRLLHGPILARMISISALFWEVPLLIETGLGPHFDEVWAVVCEPKEQEKRLLARYGDQSLVDGILGTQLSPRVKSTFADRIIRTDQSPQTVNLLSLEHARKASEHLARTRE